MKLKDSDLRYLLNLHHLEKLNLSGTPITDRGLQNLKGLSLKKLVLKDCPNITKKGADAVAQLMPDTSVRYSPEWQEMKPDEMVDAAIHRLNEGKKEPHRR